ncbi:hypothetical protein N9341_04485 [Candidatus Pelagibacter sp.]|nr:hypothetical protein [Candidatus Pelagibacter sp.]
MSNLINNKKFLLVVIIIGFISLIISAYLGEDTLGGARYDYLFHEKYIIAFNENFLLTFADFGNNYKVRNSPIFFIYSSLFLKLGFDIQYLKYFNLIIIIPLIIFFIKCLELRFEKISFETKAFFISIIFISPTIRSLSAWPYPLIWAICFFLISIFYFLKFKKTSSRKEKIKYSILNTLFLALSAYFTPNFAIFAIYYLFYFFKYFETSIQTYLLIALNIVLSFPGLYFIIINDFYLFKHEVNNVKSNYSLFDTLNISNKIIIISSIFFFFFIPFLNLIKIKNKFSIKNSWFLILFILINIIFFNFSKGLGGGFFFHLSNILLDGPELLFLIFIISLFIMKSMDLFHQQNIFIFFIILFYNIQSTIYFKYFDPILYFIILFLLKFKIEPDLNKISKKCFVLYLFFLFTSFGKKYIIY